MTSSSASAVPWAARAGVRTWSSTTPPGEAKEFHSSLPGYRPTPLVECPELAAELGVAAVFVKDEADRLGLPAFKILGASWAVNCALSQRCGLEPARSLTELRDRSGPITLVTATDGNSASQPASTLPRERHSRRWRQSPGKAPRSCKPS